MRIDAHVHFTPPSMAADLTAFSEQEPYWGLLLGGGSGAVQGWATAERMIEDMDRAGIDRVILMGEYRRHHDACVARNDQALALNRRWPDRVIAFAVLQPLAGQLALDELARCLDGGMAGVGELGPYGQGYTLDDPAFLKLVEACIRRGVSVNLHTNEEIGHFYPGKATTPLRHYYRLAERYPELKLILAHWGGGLLFYEMMPEVRRVLRNVWYDTAGSPLLFPTSRIFNAALACVDHRKLLYASDYPLLVYPRRQVEPDFRPFLAEIDGLALADDVRADVMGDNAARLLGFLPSPVQAELPPIPRRRVEVVTEIPDPAAVRVEPFMAVSAVAQAWPQTQAVFERHGIPWSDRPVPGWEPIVQAAAVLGMGSDAQARLLAELNEAAADA